MASEDGEGVGVGILRASSGETEEGRGQALLKRNLTPFSAPAMKKRTRYPRAIDPARVGKYPASAYAGGGFVWDAVLEYRVWCHPENGAPDEADGNDYYFAFASYPEALKFSREFAGAEEPVVLILQKEYIDEPIPGRYVHIKKRRVTEWPVEFLARPLRTKDTIPDFLSPNAPRNRLAILRGIARKRGS